MLILLNMVNMKTSRYAGKIRHFISVATISTDNISIDSLIYTIALDGRSSEPF
jgi:hypothetical protein